MKNENVISNVLLVQNDAGVDIRESGIIKALEDNGFVHYDRDCAEDEDGEQELTSGEIKEYEYVKEDDAKAGYFEDEDDDEESYYYEADDENENQCQYLCVNLSNKTFASYSSRSISADTVLFGHAISVSEFWKIYSIFVRYDGLPDAFSSKENALACQMAKHIAQDERKEYFKDLNLDDYSLKCKNVFLDMVATEQLDDYVDTFIENKKTLLYIYYKRAIYPKDLWHMLSSLYKNFKPSKVVKSGDKKGTLKTVCSVDLVSQTMKMQLVAYELYMIKDLDGAREKEYMYSFSAKNTFTEQSININLTDSVPERMIAELYLALSREPSSKSLGEIHQWNHIEFFIVEEYWERRVTINAYLLEIPDEYTPNDRCNCITFALEEKEIDKLKEFLLEFYKYIDATRNIEFQGNHDFFI